MSRLAGVLVCLSVAFQSAAQINRYFVSFRDKTGTPFTLSSPGDYLSERSIARRSRNGVAVTVDDLPVTPGYVSQVRSTGAVVFFTSRWRNGVIIEATEPQRQAVAMLSMVASVQLIAPGPKSSSWGRQRKRDRFAEDPAVGSATRVQLTQIGVDQMHVSGYHGEGVWVGIFDSGFIGVNTTNPFQHLFTGNRVMYSFNFVNNRASVFERDDHGTEVMSVLAAQTASFAGALTNATYLLFLTEDVASEYRIEEYNWTIAAERADSAGVDVINSSLGYYDFDDPSMNYAKADLTGDRAVVTRAATMARDRGMIVVCSAGNEGAIAWKLVTPPADADGILAVGAVNSSGLRTGFSSTGPTADNRIKPDVMALGSGTTVINQSGNVTTASGTSLASPLVAGLAGGLLQYNPSWKASDVVHAIKGSASLAARPDQFMGYGIPNFYAAVRYQLAQDNRDNITLYPNPVDTPLMIAFKELPEEPVWVTIADLTGRTCLEYQREINWQSSNPLQLDVAQLVSGLYLVKVQTNRETVVFKLLKN
ncbi:MAG: S8/S53 family peptidase [Cyclobacteriaceae bacterium]